MENSKREDGALKVVCPYCLKEIAPKGNKCQECGTTFGVDTLKILRRGFEGPSSQKAGELRERDRFVNRFRISFPTADSLKDHYLLNISTCGVFINTDKPFSRGARFDLQIILPDGQGPVDVYCEVIWSQNRKRIIDKKLYPAGMGVKFLNLSVEGRERIYRLLDNL